MEMTQKYRGLSLVLRTLGQYVKISKHWILFEHSVTVLSACSFLVSVLVTEYTFDLLAVASQGGNHYNDVVVALVALVLVMLLQQLLRALDKYLLGYISYRNVGRLMAELMLKLSRVSAYHFEDPDFLDDIETSKSCIEYEELGYFATNCLRSVTYYGVFFVSFAVYFFKFSPILPIIIILLFIPAILGQLAQTKVFAHLEAENAPLRRQFDYYKRAIASQENFKETRTLGAYQYFHRLFTDTLYHVTQKTWQVEKKVSFRRFLLGLISFIGLGIATVLLFQTAMSGAMSIGTFIAIFSALSQIFRMAEEWVNVYVSEGTESLGKIATYFKLLDMEELTGEVGEFDMTQGVQASHVVFQYPKSTQVAIDGVNLQILPGETIAIVGENGSGKSTLIKLLTGLYAPTQGQLTVGGLNTNTTVPIAIYPSISAVFQNFIRYKMTLEENITMSDSREKPHQNEVQRVLEEVKFQVEGVNLTTMLSPDFDGIDLSGGQWQRLAIARGLYRPHQMIVLDEPTSAIDPLEEERVYRQFKELVVNKTAILVTHRLASAQFADRIIVMDHGKISEIGNHHTLMAQQGKYAQLWQAQAAWYDRES